MISWNFIVQNKIITTNLLIGKFKRKRNEKEKKKETFSNILKKY